MNALCTLQHAFQAAVLGAADTDAWTGPPGAGMAVYRHAYRARLGEVLALEFPKLAAWLGPAAFERLADAYVDVQPSRHASVRDFGAEFPAFLGRQADLPERRRRAALARFEWALGAVFDAPDAAAITPERLAALPPADWAGLRLGLVPALRICRCEPCIPALWQRLEGRAPAELPAARTRVAPHLVWRSGTRVRFRALADDEAVALGLLARRRRLAAFCEALASRLPGAPAAATAARLLRRFAVLGILAAPADPR
ncbi:MAG: putative DNA-binding domain-containing protein [Gammaproteobacteria bacterium]|nr:putative DNA-binding domain-containing protein [Gammaproteobacteria bacterium]MBI5618566.1 putative DNA-binding domain-containing protein [Gammaproteobacteria bacterium]